MGLTRNDEDTALVWARGERGWGSGPDTSITQFQQHPPDFPLFQNDDDVTQIDETAADMFLNWVYRINSTQAQISHDTIPYSYFEEVQEISPETPGMWLGFLNSSWFQNSANSLQDCSVDDSICYFSGNARFVWMEIVMRAIKDQMQWG